MRSGGPAGGVSGVVEGAVQSVLRVLVDQGGRQVPGPLPGAVAVGAEHRDIDADDVTPTLLLDGAIVTGTVVSSRSGSDRTY